MSRTLTTHCFDPTPEARDRLVAHACQEVGQVRVRERHRKLAEDRWVGDCPESPEALSQVSSAYRDQTAMSLHQVPEAERG